MKQLSALIFTFLLVTSCATNANEFGEFVGSVKVEWLEDGRQMRLLDDFKYVDPSGRQWLAPKGWVVDGASIPQVAWAIIGSPYVGRYRTASVIHDVGCDQKEQPWEDVHEALYNAMRAADVSETKAKTIYGAVYHFGPRWEYTMDKTVDESDVEKTVTMMKKSTPAKDFRVKVQPKSRTFIERMSKAPKKANVQVIVAPAVKTMRQVDFKKLQQQIETQGLDLEAIRNFKP